MKLREFPGALALGLLASLGAHTALYGSSHEMGGAFHSELVTVAVAALGGLLVAFGALAWTGSRHAADGSVLAARLTGRLPGLAPVLVATALCFALGERLEPAHAATAFWPLVAAIVASADTASGSGAGGDQDAGRCHRRHLAPGLRDPHAVLAAPRRAGLRRRARAFAAPALRPSSSVRERPARVSAPQFVRTVSVPRRTHVPFFCGVHRRVLSVLVHAHRIRCDQHHRSRRRHRRGQAHRRRENHARRRRVEVRYHDRCERRVRLLADPVRPLRAHGHVGHASAGQRRRDRYQR